MDIKQGQRTHRVLNLDRPPLTSIQGLVKLVSEPSTIIRSSSVDFTDLRSVTSMEDLGFSMPLRGSEKPSK